MPLIEPTFHRPFPYCFSGHWQTILPVLLRRVPPAAFTPERIETDDGDFLDLDGYRRGFPRLAILSHGLEGSSRASYIRGMAAVLSAGGWDVLAWNFRGCSGEMNRLPRLYHSGATEDLRRVIDHAAPGYAAIGLVGFSLGGNMTLKYLGEAPETVHPKITASVTFSVPCDLAASAVRLSQPANRLYTWRFLRSLKKKVITKARQFPGKIDASNLRRVRSFYDFDDRYTAPLHGFHDAHDYWKRCSSRQFLERIRVPALIVNARNDPFLPQECFPEKEAQANPSFYLDVPAHGGHVGFASGPGAYWSEPRTLAFLNQWSTSL